MTLTMTQPECAALLALLRDDPDSWEIVQDALGEDEADALYYRIQAVAEGQRNTEGLV